MSAKLASIAKRLPIGKATPQDHDWLEANDQHDALRAHIRQREERRLARVDRSEPDVEEESEATEEEAVSNVLTGIASTLNELADDQKRDADRQEKRTRAVAE